MNHPSHEAGPIAHTVPGAVTVRDPDRAEALLRDPHVVARVARDESGAGAVFIGDDVPTISEFLAMWYTNKDDYPFVSTILRRAFTARALEDFVAPCTELAIHRVATMPSEGDLVREYLSPALLHGTFTILGMPPDHWSRLERVTAVLLRVFHSVLRGTGGAGGISATAAQAFEVAIRYLKALTDHVLDQGGHTPFLDALRQITLRATTRWSSVAVLGQVLMAGTEPMVVGAAQACRQIWSDPVLHAGLRTGSVDAGLITEQVLLRYPPFHTLFRFVREPCDCSGSHLPVGTAIAIDVAAVNLARELAVTPSGSCPVRPASVLTFGRGEHYCLGASAARIQLPLVILELVRGAPTLRIDQDQVHITTNGFLCEVHALPYSTS